MAAYFSARWTPSTAHDQRRATGSRTSTSEGVLHGLPQPSKLKLAKLRSNRDPAGHRNHVMQRFAVGHLKSTTGILSWTHTNSTGSQTLFAPARKTCKSMLLIQFAGPKENYKYYLLHWNIKKETQPELQWETDKYLGSWSASVQLGFICGAPMIEILKCKSPFQLVIN